MKHREKDSHEKKKGGTRELQDNSKQPAIWVVESQRKRGRKQKILEDIMADMFANLVETLSKEAQ